MEHTATTIYDVIIIGGSYTGLQAALTLGRSLRKVLVIDGGQPCNRQAPHSHNFLTHDGHTPAAIAAAGKKNAAAYPTVSFVEAQAIDAKKNENGFVVTTDKDQLYSGKKILLATGIKDDLSAIPGLAECWGISIIHCPYCHGYEVRNENTGILGDAATAYELAKMLGNWTDKLTVFTDGVSTIKDDALAFFQKKGIQHVTKKIKAIEHQNGQIKQFRFDDDSTHELIACYYHAPFAHPLIVESLGCKLDDMGLIDVGEFGQTSVEGVYAAGDNSSRMRAVAAAVATGMKVAAGINREMIMESVAV